jgi:hypothetical protein
MAAGAGAAAAIARAVQASGTIIRVEPSQYQQMLNRMQSPLVVQTYRGGIIASGYQYLTSYKGLAFYTRSKERLQLPGSAEVIEAKRIWVP